MPLSSVSAFVSASLVVFSVLSLFGADAAVKDSPLSPKEKAQGFVSLFNRRYLDGWVGATKGYKVEDGVLVCPKKGGGNLYTQDEYGDFILRFEFKLTPGRTTGSAFAPR